MMNRTGDKSESNNRFLADGYERARTAVEAEVHAQVEQEFREALAGDSWFERLVIQRKMAQEMRRRIERLAPPDALY